VSKSVQPVSRWSRVVACLLIALVLSLLTFVGLEAQAFSGLQQRAADSIQPRGEAPPEVYVVGIDERTLIEVGVPWPWTRDLHADLVRALDEAGAEVIALDILFAPPAPGDDVLAEAVGEAGNVLLAETVRVGGRSDRGLLTAELVSEPSPAVAEQALLSAQVAVLPDRGDGVVREVPLLIDDGRSLSAGLSIAAVAAAADDVTGPPVVRPGAVQLGSRSIPTTDDAALIVSYAPELSSDSSPRVLSAVDVLDGTIEEGLLDGAVVFVGATDPTLGDHHLTPVAKQGGMAGVLIHANAYSTIATQAYLAPASTESTVLAVFLLTLIAALAIQFLRLWISPLVILASVIVFVVVGFVEADRGTIPNFVYPAMMLILAVPASIGFRYLLEVRQRRVVSDLFSLYVPPSVADELLESGLVDEVVAGQRLEISTMFCDLRGFTAMSAEHDPGQVREMLDHYYEFASEIVMRNHGTLMQYVGDEVFAVFGAPVPDDAHAQHAVDCASQLQTERHLLTATLEERGLPPLVFGIGVNSGPVVAAHTGSSFRRQYTVIGDTVNTGSRLCSQAGCNAVVIADSVAAQLDDPPEKENMGRLDMKGVRDDFVAWRLVLPGVVAEDR
jgi:adenylate cyclase